VNVDVQGLQFVESLRTVLPSTAVIALSKDPAKRATAVRLGATAVPAATPSAKLGALIDALL